MQTYLITKRNETGNLKPEPGSSPSVRQEVDLDIRVPRSAIVPDRKFFGSKHGDDQLMTNFVVPQLQLQKTIGVKTGTEPAAAEPGRTQNPAEAVTARRTQVRGLWQNRTSAELRRPLQDPTGTDSKKVLVELQENRGKKRCSHAEESTNPNHLNLRLEERNRNP